MKVHVKQDHCIGAGQCVLTAPTVFDQDDYGIVVLVNDSPADTDRDAVKQAANLCPANVITVVD
jgi:ferredoxin